MPFVMAAVLKNIELKTSTMGSRQEFRDMVHFINHHKIKPVISNVAEGFDLQAIDGLFEHMMNGSQFGKLVITIPQISDSKL